MLMSFEFLMRLRVRTLPAEKEAGIRGTEKSREAGIPVVDEEEQFP